ncbi:preprotein translocase subunit SecG [Candidatus Kuenenbacteria bacterium HGW-Kuenenbacteria-1]|uniref:Protein-export membrane protein SecG n=1 Tax=Candidatus Kuenenbacteria bacterium HGW-Kuenenbacteria-1 TaxID=2013812 RepID=A0A2N1UP64_9BACT|nr:MAG: preprotein translocase subunit SecG [Candidatus Kuenenbacteria bacterium HGW-Kuenenbacteria-1]
MKILTIIQVIVSIFLIISILLQSKGSGLGAVFGGGENIYQVKRGIEKYLFIFTIVLSILFLGLGIINILLAQ